MNDKTPIIIPAYEPDERMILLIEDLVKAGQKKIIIVDDGSGEKYSGLFARAKELIAPEGTVISYSENKGKGGALKTAFSYVLKNMPGVTGTVTADSDGQHTVECIKSVEQKLLENPKSLVLGVRSFDKEGIPWKSEFGNKLTRKVLRYVSGIKVSDTQTGLRGIPLSFLPECLAIRENRFEYEMEVLLRTSGKIKITETPIKTVYDSKENHQTHFNPFVDSLKVYRVLCKRFFIFIFSSFSASIIDLTLFTLFCFLLKERFPEIYIIIATVLARIISACYNYAMNYKNVFQSKSKVSSSGSKYALLAVLQMSCSALMVNSGKIIMPFMPETVIKIVVDTLLFFVSYKIQQKFVYPLRSKKSDI